MAIDRDILFQSFGISDIGLVREKNEDAWAALEDRGFFLLADGMGGHAGGEIASKEAIAYFVTLFNRWILSDNRLLEEAKSFFEEAFRKINLHIYEEGQQNEQLRGMGTTLCCLYFLQNQALMGHVGDSRIYRLRASHLQQLTEDHSLINEMLSLGAIKNEQSSAFPYKHILTRAIGTHAKVEPTIGVTDSQSGDCFMLCSDGLTNFVSEGQIEGVLTKGIILEEKGQALVDLAKQEGGADNISIVLVEVL